MKQANIDQLMSKLLPGTQAWGVILAVCKEGADKSLARLTKDWQTNHKDQSAEFVYDGQRQMLAVLLENQRLAGTHYYALMLKEYLLERNLLAGSLLLAGFSERSPASPETVERMVRELLGLEGFAEIRFFDQRLLDKEESARILLVNHDQTVTEFLRIYLQRKGYEVTVASDGMAGMQKYREIAPDLVITDLNLPVINGYQLIQQIQGDQPGQKSKIVVLTDKRLEEDVQKSFALGASDYITKPFSPVELAARVKRLIS
ncbi:PleD family two-component system response regulator [Brevibacillus sp. TJ4]|uniref:response regulator n=1 Tax=Brevibacillus sp. TJ4 TaxID=3234853 RepID=UPI0037D1E07A